MPSLTEGWAAAYFGALVTVLVFAVGLQGLVYQVLVPDDLRVVVHRHREGFTPTYIASTIGLSAILFIWLLHPGDQSVGGSWQSFLGAAVITISLGATVLYCMALTRRCNRPAVVDRLFREATQAGIRQLHEPAVADLAYLGQHGAAGAEKDLVLHTLSKLADLVQADPAYAGSELEDIVAAVTETLLSDEHPGSDANFISGAAILAKVIRQSADRRMKDCPDVAVALRSATRLAVHAVRRQSDAVVFSFFNLGEQRSIMLYSIGIESVDAKRFRLAMAALSKLESAAKPANSYEPYLAGLLARFWASGESARNEAGKALRRLSAIDRDAFARSAEYHQSRGDFETSDAIRALIADHWP